MHIYKLLLLEKCFNFKYFCAFHKRNAALLVKDSDDEAEDGENGDGDHDEDDENVDGLNKRRRFEEGKFKYRGLTLMRKNMQSA